MIMPATFWTLFLCSIFGFADGAQNAPLVSYPNRESVGVATKCADQGEYCYCKYGKVRYGIEPDWSKWTYVHNAERVLCDHDNAHFPDWQSVAWFSTHFCQCEKLEDPKDVKSGIIPTGEILYLFKVEAFATPTDRISPDLLAIIQKRAAKAKGVVEDKNNHWWYEELPKQIAVVGAGVAAGAVVSIFAGPLVIAAIGGHSVVLGATAIFAAAGANYVASATAKGTTRLLLQTDDMDRAFFETNEAIVEIGARAATLGIMDGGGLGHLVSHTVHHGLGAVTSDHTAKSGEHMITLGDKIVTFVGGTVVEVPIEHIHKSGLEVMVEAGDGSEREIAMPDKIPSIRPEPTSLGIILNLLISGATIHSTMYGGGLAGYPALADNLQALQKACLSTLEKWGPGDVPDRRLVELAIAERTVGQIFHPNHDFGQHFNSYPGSRFPECMHDGIGIGKLGKVTGVVPSKVPVCYCIRNDYKAKVNKGPELGVDVDFCIYGQVCMPGEGVQNAKCAWPSAESQMVMGRMFAAFNAGVRNCISQHLNGWRCTQCQVRGEKCITEDADGECAMIRDEQHGFTCKRPGVEINEDGTPVRPNQKKDHSAKNVKLGRLTLAVREVVKELPRQSASATSGSRAGTPLIVPPRSGEPSNQKPQLDLKSSFLNAWTPGGSKPPDVPAASGSGFRVEPSNPKQFIEEKKRPLPLAPPPRFVVQPGTYRSSAPRGPAPVQSQSMQTRSSMQTQSQSMRPQAMPGTGLDALNRQPRVYGEELFVSTANTKSFFENEAYIIGMFLSCALFLIIGKLKFDEAREDKLPLLSHDDLEL